MAAATVTGPLAHPLAGTSGALASFLSSLKRSLQGLRSAITSVRSLKRALDRYATAQRQPVTVFGQVSSGWGQLGQSGSRFGKQTVGTRTGLLKAKAGIQRLARKVKGLVKQWMSAARTALLFAKGLGKAGKLSSTFGGKLDLVTKVWDLVNLVMKTSPLILIATLLAPFIQQLIEYALDSELGKQLMSGLFSTMEVLIKVAFVGMMPTIIGIKAGAEIFKAIVRFVKDPVGFIKNDVPKGFRHIGEATLGFLKGAAGGLKTGLKAAAGFLKLPADLLIGLGNAIVDALNHIPGVSLDRIPALAKGGIVAPRTGGVPVVLAEAGEAEAVIPLPKLEQLLHRTQESARAAAASAPARASSLTHYYEPEGRGSFGIAEELLFLAQTHSSRR
ncbi:hypothetical protein [Streptomyces luteireticuli]|uniref:Tape-measure protein n=1 Tax=Streptomyces luteireticuli TaxID=173858 RepID=A0ABP3IYI8_9ACTN